MFCVVRCNSNIFKYSYNSTFTKQKTNSRPIYGGNTVHSQLLVSSGSCGSKRKPKVTSGLQWTVSNIDYTTSDGHSILLNTDIPYNLLCMYVYHASSMIFIHVMISCITDILLSLTVLKIYSSEDISIQPLIIVQDTNCEDATIKKTELNASGCLDKITLYHFRKKILCLSHLGQTWRLLTGGQYYPSSHPSQKNVIY